MAPRGNRINKRVSPPRGKGKGKRPSAASAGDNPFFEEEPKSHRARADEDVESGDSDDDGLALGTAAVEDGEDKGEEKEVEETAREKKLRMTKEYLTRIKDAVKRSEEEEEDDEDLDGASGGRGSAKLLKKKLLEIFLERLA